MRENEFIATSSMNCTDLGKDGACVNLAELLTKDGFDPTSLIKHPGDKCRFYSMSMSKKKALVFEFPS